MNLHSPETVQRLAIFFDTTPEWILHGDVKKPVQNALREMPKREFPFPELNEAKPNVGHSDTSEPELVDDVIDVEPIVDDNEVIVLSNTEKSLKVFDFEEYIIRTVIGDDGETLFFAKDVCDVLGYANARDAVTRHCKEKGVVKRDILTEGGKQQAIFINEPNLMRLIVKSKLPAAEKFEAWRGKC